MFAFIVKFVATIAIVSKSFAAEEVQIMAPQMVLKLRLLVLGYK